MSGLGRERRRFPRVPLRMRVNAVGRNQFISDFARDVSEGGIGLQVATPIEQGTEVTLHLFLPDHSKPIRAKGRVVWVKGADEGTQENVAVSMGIEFAELDAAAREALRSYVRNQLGAAPP